MDNDTIKEIIKEEFENKKSYDANFRFRCSGCRNWIEEGEPFYFVGNKKRVCGDCLAELQESI